jgi:hypothetical protein
MELGNAQAPLGAVEYLEKTGHLLDVAYFNLWILPVSMLARGRLQ